MILDNRPEGNYISNGDVIFAAEKANNGLAVPETLYGMSVNSSYFATHGFARRPLLLPLAPLLHW